MNLGYQKSVEGEALASGQCAHPYLWKNGFTKQGKPRIKCAVCRKIWTIGAREKLNKFERAKQILPYVKQGWSLSKIAKKFSIAEVTVYKARKLLKKYMEVPVVKRWPYHKRSYKENCEFILNNPQLTNKEIAKELKLTYQRVIWYRKQLGLTNQKYNSYKNKVMVAGNGS